MEYYDFKVFNGSLQQNLYQKQVYSSVPLVNRGNTLESRWIHLKVGIQFVLFSVGKVHANS